MSKNIYLEEIFNTYKCIVTASEIMKSNIFWKLISYDSYGW